jgi:hypothetical protein
MSKVLKVNKNSVPQIVGKIYFLRGVKVMIDADLATLYDTETKRLKEAVRRNHERFPADFMFQLNKKELKDLRTQIASSKNGGSRYMPFVFTEQGVAMLSGILNSKKAIQVNIQIMRAFVFVRQYALSHKDLTEKLNELEKKYDKQFKDVYEALNFLIGREKQKESQQDRRKIGYKPELNEPLTLYKTYSINQKTG